MGKASSPLNPVKGGKRPIAGETNSLRFVKPKSPKKNGICLVTDFSPFKQSYRKETTVLAKRAAFRATLEDIYAKSNPGRTLKQRDLKKTYEHLVKNFEEERKLSLLKTPKVFSREEYVQTFRSLDGKAMASRVHWSKGIGNENLRAALAMVEIERKEEIAKFPKYPEKTRNEVKSKEEQDHDKEENELVKEFELWG